MLKVEVGYSPGQQRCVIFHNVFHYDGIFDNSKDHNIFGTRSQFRCQKESYEKVIVGWTSGSLRSILVIGCVYRRYNVGALVPTDAVILFFNEILPVDLASFRKKSKD
jgi:hypothetical protein